MTTTAPVRLCRQSTVCRLPSPSTPSGLRMRIGLTDRSERATETGNDKATRLKADNCILYRAPGRPKCRDCCGHTSCTCYTLTAALGLHLSYFLLKCLGRAQGRDGEVTFAGLTQVLQVQRTNSLLFFASRNCGTASSVLFSAESSEQRRADRDNISP
jgi:hypothetical protein